jgi:hypothetical protein
VVAKEVVVDGLNAQVAGSKSWCDSSRQDFGVHVTDNGPPLLRLHAHDGTDNVWYMVIPSPTLLEAEDDLRAYFFKIALVCSLVSR